jgi:hypothetical protein
VVRYRRFPGLPEKQKKAPRPNEAQGKGIGWLRPTKGALEKV